MERVNNLDAEGAASTAVEEAAARQHEKYIAECVLIGGALAFAQHNRQPQ